MRRVVITGIGIVSCIGNNKKEVLNSLVNTKSGIVFSEEHKKYNFRSQIVGNIKNLNLSEHIDRKQLRFMGDGSAYNFISLKEAIEESGLKENDISNEMTGLVVGSGGASGAPLVEMADTLRNKGARKVNPFYVPKIMSSCNAANLATAFKIRGYSYTISSACATSSHCLGNAYQLIQAGEQDLMFVGGGDELSWVVSIAFDAMGALSSNFNDSPKLASRAYDKDRDGFVVAGGGGTIVLEDYDRAKARGASIYCEVTGYGISSDGHDMVRPSGEGAERCMQMALKNFNGEIDYLNAHGTSTPAGDITELMAIKNVFDEKLPKIGSTKSLTGHSLGAAGVHEAIYCILMMNNDFICPSANIKNLDPEAKDYPIVIEAINDCTLNHVMSNSFGFGGTNCSLIFSKI